MAVDVAIQIQKFALPLEEMPLEQNLKS